MSATKSRSKKAHPKWDNYVASMKYAKYVLFHPFDGFWDLTHEKRGSLAAATTFLVLFLLTRVAQLMFTNFQFINAPLQYINTLKLQRAVELLSSKYYTVSEVAAQCGFANPYYFSTFIKRETGRSPSEFIQI